MVSCPPLGRRLGLALAWGGAVGVGLPAAELVLEPERCQVEAEARATFGGFTVHLRRFRAEVAVDEASGEIRGAVLTFDVTELTAGRRSLDAAMVEWLEAARFPQATYRLGRLVRQADGSDVAYGTLLLHGIEHAVNFPVTVLNEGSRFVLAGEGTLDYRDHGLPLARRYLVRRVDPQVRVRFHLQGHVPAG